MTAPITGTIEQIGAGNGAQILRLRKMIVLMANEGAPAITSIVAADGNTLSIAGDYRSVGYLGKDEGASLTPGREISDSTAYGFSQPINQYATSESFAVGFTMKETLRSTLEAYYGSDLSAIRANFATGEIVIDPTRFPHGFEPLTQYAHARKRT